MSRSITSPKPSVQCGETNVLGIAHGCGAGSTSEQAFESAFAEARFVATAAGEAWIAEQICPVTRPVKNGLVHIPPRKCADGSQSAEVVSENKIRGKSIEPDGNPIIFRVCVAITWEAVVTCKSRFETEE